MVLCTFYHLRVTAHIGQKTCDNSGKTALPNMYGAQGYNLVCESAP